MYYTVDNQVLDVDIHRFFHIDMWKNLFPKTRMWKTDTYTAEKREN